MFEEEASFTGGSPHHLSSSRSSSKKILVHHVWCISEFHGQREMFPPGQHLESALFGDGGYEFQLKFFPSGVIEMAEEHLGAYLVIKNFPECPEDHIRISVQYKILLVASTYKCAISNEIITVQRNSILSASRLISTSAVLSSPATYLPNDVFTFKVEITIYSKKLAITEMVDPESTAVAIPVFTPKKFNDNFSPFLESGELCDFVIEASGDAFRVHKIILYQHAEFFAAMFRSQPQCKKVKLDIDSAIMTIILKYIYCGQLPSEEDVSTDLIYATDRLLVRELTSVCLCMICKKITVDTVLDIFKLVYDIQDETLHTYILHFFLQHRSAIKSTDKWRELRSSDPYLLSELLELALTEQENVVVKENPFDRK